jgi:uncharacterized protein YcfJ
LLAALLLIPGLSFAQSHQIGENVTYGYAQVLRASPVYETVRVSTPEQRCDGPSREGDGTKGTIIGAVVGGALGNRVGKGDGRKAATVAGAVIGGAVGHHIDKNNGPGHCHMVEVVHEERRLAGYDVEYTFKGEKYMSRLDNDPGNRLRIRVSVMPDELVAGFH